MPRKAPLIMGLNPEASIVGSIFGSDEHTKYGSAKPGYTEPSYPEEPKKKKIKGPRPQGITTDRYYKGPKY